MTAINLAGASSTLFLWSTIDWEAVEKNVHRLQVRIAKAIRQGKYGKAKALQWLLTKSYSAKLLVIRKVTSNAGSRTPGIDGVRWTTDQQKLKAIILLNRKGYKASPLKRINIPKSNGKSRPLGIPTMKDRAMQALYLLALEPVSETLADGNSYGFRPKRSCQDAIEQCFKILCRKSSVKWVLEADIEGCFDNISHDYLLDNIPTDKKILYAWLKAGYLENGSIYPTKSGTPQGGIISPVLANMTLDGLESTIQSVSKQEDRVNFVRYADDFIVTAKDRECLETVIKPAVSEFLAKRGLKLSKLKTKITNMDYGFDFLGFNVKKYNEKLLIKPSKKSVQDFLDKAKKIIRTYKSGKVGDMLHDLNPKIIGWCNYYRHVVSSKVFSHVDHHIFLELLKWMKARHPNKNTPWRIRKYFQGKGLRNWIFGINSITKEGEPFRHILKKMSDTHIKRHIKIIAKATPYNPEYREYFKRRKRLGHVRWL